jgi:hypothetical protein
MVYYSDDPNLGIKTVTTFSGNKEYRKNCKKIKDNYYVINKECFLIGDTWYRIDSGLIAKDYEKGDWFLTKNRPKDVVQGYVDMEHKILGFFTRNPYKNVIIASGSMYVFDEETAVKGGYVEDKSTGKFIRKGDATDKIYNSLDHTHKGYNIEDNKEEYPAKVKLYNEYPTQILDDIRNYAVMLGDTTFGAELECQKGYLPDYLQARMGVVVCRDGSLKDENGRPGPEFVTIPLSGEKGLQTLVDICKALSIRTEIGLNCSLHLHLGNINTDKRFMVGLYRLCHKIQNEIFQMFPYYKANPDGIKHKNYNQKLPTLQIYTCTDEDKKGLTKFIDESYRKIFMWLAEGALEPEKNSSRKVYKHPHPNKWERHARYYWMNSMNVIFSERNTIEFRLHTPTTNAQKVFNWLFICNAIVRFAEEHAEEIITSRKRIRMSEILNYYASKFGDKGVELSEYLIGYVRSRKDSFYCDYQKGNYVSEWDITQDKQYVFPFKGIENIFK